MSHPVFRAPETKNSPPLSHGMPCAAKNTPVLQNRGIPSRLLRPAKRIGYRFGDQTITTGSYLDRLPRAEERAWVKRYLQAVKVPVTTSGAVSTSSRRHSLRPCSCKEWLRVRLETETSLFGQAGVLDSLGLVTLLVSVEQAIEHSFALSVTLAE